MADILPGYRYSNEANRYVSNVTGRFVARREIMGLLNAQTNQGGDRLVDLATALRDGRISRGVFAEQFALEIKRQHLQNRALGAGGWDRLTAADYGAVGGKLQADYRRLLNFADAIANGEITIAQALNRANMYAGNARTQYWDAWRSRNRAGVGRTLIEKRNLGAAEHCGDCTALHARGWQMAGQLPTPGDGSTECLSNCRCTLEVREVDVLIVGEWLGTRR
jgi:hypothetical protein